MIMKGIFNENLMQTALGCLYLGPYRIQNRVEFDRGLFTWKVSKPSGGQKKGCEAIQWPRTSNGLMCGSPWYHRHIPIAELATKLVCGAITPTAAVIHAETSSESNPLEGCTIP